jgi:hypothetical protein
MLMSFHRATDAFCEGLAAYRQYEHLRSRGIPHGRAVSEALGVGPTLTGPAWGRVAIIPCRQGIEHPGWLDAALCRSNEANASFASRASMASTKEADQENNEVTVMASTSTSAC